MSRKHTESLEGLKKESVRNYILEHVHDDPVKLILSTPEIDGVDIKLIAEQIKARQKAFKKFPDWAKNFKLIFPSALSVEQASSQETAHYKASIVDGELCIDLTGGLGVDTLAFSKKFEKVIYVESDEGKAVAAKHNFKSLGAENIEVHHATAEEFLNSFQQTASLIYLDPDRRPGQQKVLSLQDSLPNVLNLKDTIFSKSTATLIKASPMLDISATLKELPEFNEVHTLAIDNECKELLFLRSSAKSLVKIASHLRKDEWEKIDSMGGNEVNLSAPLDYLYEPNAAIMKAGLQDNATSQFHLEKLHPSTHLYTSKDLIPEFPGRIFKVENITAVNKKGLKEVLPGLKANITTRNFPEHVDRLKKKLGLKDGGNYYLFACRLNDNSYKLLITQKAV